MCSYCSSQLSRLSMCSSPYVSRSLLCRVLIIRRCVRFLMICFIRGRIRRVPCFYYSELSYVHLYLFSFCFAFLRRVSFLLFVCVLYVFYYQWCVYYSSYHSVRSSRFVLASLCYVCLSSYGVYSCLFAV